MSDDSDWAGSWDGNEQVGYYTSEQALRTAGLWKAGKLIGGDAEQVLYAVLRAHDALKADIERHVAIAANLATENERLRRALTWIAQGGNTIPAGADYVKILEDHARIALEP